MATVRIHPAVESGARPQGPGSAARKRVRRRAGLRVAQAVATFPARDAGVHAAVLSGALSGIPEG